MAGVTIPAKLHASMLKTFEHEYVDEFGPLDAVRPYTREELVDKYARDVRFWKKRVPEITRDRRPSIREVCAHAIATNALANMKKLIGERGIEEDVRAQLRDVYELDYD